jgi:hypothetical protein
VVFFLDTQASYLVGKTPVALNTHLPAPSQQLLYVGVKPGYKISFVKNP